MVGSIDGAECSHGVSVFDSRGCTDCSGETRTHDDDPRCNMSPCLCLEVHGRADEQCVHYRRGSNVTTEKAA